MTRFFSLGIWEQLNNPIFKPIEFDGIKMQAGLNSFTLTPKRPVKHHREIKYDVPGIRWNSVDDLDVLLSLLDDPDFNSFRKYALILNSYAVDASYPGDYIEPEREEAVEALRMAVEIYDLVKQKLGH